MRVYVLGAGTSKPDGVPVTSEVVDRAFRNVGEKIKENTFRMGHWSEQEGKSIRRVLELMDLLYKKGLVAKFDRYDGTIYRPYSLGVTTDMLEDFFTKLHYMERGEMVGITLSQEELRKITKDARFLYFGTLCDAMRSCWLNFKYYPIFVEKALRREGNHCIISFNYDLLLEHALIDMDKYLKYDGKQWRYPDDLKWRYGVKFKGFYYSEPYQFPEKKDAKIHYFKLHGSFNFGYCPESKEVSVYESIRAAGNLYQEFDAGRLHCCGGTHTSAPLLIPPLKKKDIEIPALRESWEEVSEFLSQATELHILGYSLPKVDEEAKRLLQRIPSSGLKKVIIANPNREHIQKLVNILELSRKSVKIYKGFEDYVTHELGAESN